MDATQPSASSPSPSTPVASRRESDVSKNHESSLGRRSSSLDEKRSLDSSSSQSADSLLHEARALEAQPQAPEDLVPRRTKIIFVALYFFLNLALTLSNKSVLSQVSAPLHQVP